MKNVVEISQIAIGTRFKLSKPRNADEAKAEYVKMGTSWVIIVGKDRGGRIKELGLRGRGIRVIE